MRSRLTKLIGFPFCSRNAWPHLAVGAILALVATGAASAVVINIPPVEISALEHQFFTDFPFPGQNLIRDAVTFPCAPTACSGPGFTASIGTGDTVVARFEAPAGQKFVVTRHPSASLQSFIVRARWGTGVPDGGSNFVTGTVTFENLAGTPPVNTFSQDVLYDNGEQIVVHEDFDVVGDFEFTAVVVEFNVVHALPIIPRTYGSVFSASAPSFGSVAAGAGLSDQVIMQLVVACPEDVNGDNVTNVLDLISLLLCFAQPAVPGCEAQDVNGDNTVNVLDLIEVLLAFGTTCP